ncbi:universal stress protein [Jannaschia rubra]|uniref:universal stress protein n=1 Tax=Jannaschia rubra TaxID=282197 RepID=UPI00248FB5AC|nr:universal stress protein [Jannaschia rubra]
MYRNILVPMALTHGFGETALDVARRLLSGGGTITALHVHEAPSGSVRNYLDDDVVRAAHDEAKATLDARVADQPDVTPVLVTGNSGRAILDVAARMGADCIVIGSHRPGLRDYFLGSTAARVVRHAPCAVHVLRRPDDD